MNVSNRIFSLFSRGEVRRIGIMLSMLVMVSLHSAIAQASLSAQVDRNNINEGDTFMLRLSSDGNNDQPNLAPLQKDFEVLGTAQSSQVQVLNGSVTSSYAWNITLSPRRAGQLVIPPLTAGKESSAAVSITVLPATASSGGDDHGSQEQSDVFIEVTAKPEKTYVQAQVVYTVRLYYAVPLQQGNLSEPTSDNSIVQKMGDDGKFATQRNGRSYQVLERRYALFPQKSGELNIPAVVFDGDIIEPRRGGGRFFGNDIFSVFNSTTRHMRLRSRSLHVQVTPQPPGFQGSNWLPAQDLSLEQKWSPAPPQFRVGEPVTRTLIVRSKGLSASQLPDLPLPNLAGLKTYPDQAQTHATIKEDSLVSEREQKIAMIPTQAGDLILPALRLHWWDTVTRRERIADLPAQTIHVLPALTSEQAAVVPQTESTAAATATEKSAVTTDAAPVIARAMSNGNPYASPWPWLAGFFAVAWMITLMLWWRGRRHRVPVVGETRDELSERAAVNHFKLACLQNDNREAKRLLLDWARLHWPSDAPMSLGVTARRVNDEILDAQIARLDASLYHSTAASWRGVELWQVFDAALKKNAQAPHQTADSALAPLHLNKQRTA